MPGAILVVVAAVALAYLVALLVTNGLTRAVLMVQTRSGQGDRLTRVLRAPMRLVRRLIFLAPLEVGWRTARSFRRLRREAKEEGDG